MRHAAIESPPATRSDVHRSDLHYSELHNAVELVLARSPYLAGKNLRFELHEDKVVLRGFVRSYYQKQLVQESLKGIASLPIIRNEIEVISV
jgi:hypothetical protein